MYRGLRVGPEDVYLGPKGRSQGRPKCRSRSGMSPVRAVQLWPHSQLCAGWLGRSCTTTLCGADRLVTMAEGNTILSGSQTNMRLALLTSRASAVNQFPRTYHATQHDPAESRRTASFCSWGGGGGESQRTSAVGERALPTLLSTFPSRPKAHATWCCRQRSTS